MADAECTAQDLAGIRRFLTRVLGVAMVGVAAELLLLEHTDAWQQLIPLGLLGIGFVVLVVSAVRSTPATVRCFAGVMLLFVVSGVPGTVLHYEHPSLALRSEQHT